MRSHGSYNLQTIVDNLTTFYYGTEKGLTHIRESKDYYLNQYAKGLGKNVSEALQNYFEMAFSAGSLTGGNDKIISMVRQYAGGGKKGEGTKIYLKPLYKFYEDVRKDLAAVIQETVDKYGGDMNKLQVIHGQITNASYYCQRATEILNAIKNVFDQYALTGEGDAASVNDYPISITQSLIANSGAVNFTLEDAKKIQKAFQELLMVLKGTGGALLSTTDLSKADEFSTAYGIISSFREELGEEAVLNLLEKSLTGEKQSAVSNGDISWGTIISEDQKKTNSSLGYKKESEGSKTTETPKVVIDLRKAYGLNLSGAPLEIAFRKNIETENVSQMKADIQIPDLKANDGSGLYISEKNYRLIGGPNNVKMSLRGTYLYNCLRQMQTNITNSEIIYMAIEGDYAGRRLEKRSEDDYVNYPARPNSDGKGSPRTYAKVAIILNALVGTAQKENSVNTLILNDRANQRYIAIDLSQVIRELQNPENSNNIFQASWEPFQISLSQLHREFDRGNRAAGRLRRYSSAAAQVLATVKTQAEWYPLQYSKSGNGVYIGKK